MPVPTVTLTGDATAAAAGKTIWLRATAAMITSDGVEVPVATRMITLDDEGQIPADTTIVPSTANDGDPVPYIVQQQYGNPWLTGYVTIDADPFNLMAADYVGSAPNPSPGVPPASEQALQQEITDRRDGDQTNATAITALEDDLATEAASREAADTAESTQRIDGDTALASSIATINAALPLKADLVDNVVPISQLPALALDNFYVVSTTANMVALSIPDGAAALAMVTTGPAWYALPTGADPTVLGNWDELAFDLAGLASAAQTAAENFATNAVNLEATARGTAVTNAIATAATDAQTKANAAQTAAQTYAAGLVDDGSGVTDAAAFRTALGLGSIATHPTSDFLSILTDPGTAWSTGAASVAGQMWTYSGGRWVDTQGGNLPASPATPRLIQTGVTSSVPVGYQAYNTTGVATAFTSSGANAIQLVVPSSCTVPLTVDGFATVTATSAITLLQIEIVEVSNGTDTPVVAKFLYGSLANGATVSLNLPMGAIYLPVTGRTRTLNLTVFCGSGGGNIVNSPQIAGAANGYPSGIVAKAAA